MVAKIPLFRAVAEPAFCSLLPLLRERELSAKESVLPAAAFLIHAEPGLELIHHKLPETHG